jgi:hypothetical protein
VIHKNDLIEEQIFNEVSLMNIKGVLRRIIWIKIILWLVLGLSLKSIQNIFYLELDMHQCLMPQEKVKA